MSEQEEDSKVNSCYMTSEKDWPGIVKELRESRKPEIENLAYAWRWITDRILEHTRNEIEVARAMKDSDALVKHQVKMEVVRHTRGIFQECYRLATGRRAGDE